MGSYSGWFWAMGAAPVLALLVIGAAIWYGVRASRSSALPAAKPDETVPENLKAMSHISYGLMAAAVVFPITAIAAVILDYLKQSEAGGWLVSHIRWRIRTFWFSLLWSGIGFLLFFAFGLGWLILIATGIWWIYRIVRGWVSLAERRPMYSFAAAVRTQNAG